MTTLKKYYSKYSDNILTICTTCGSCTQRNGECICKGERYIHGFDAYWKEAIENGEIVEV